MSLEALCAEIYKLAKEKNITLCCAESATGGLISHYLTEVPGISEVYQGGACTYSNESKIKLLGVKEDTLQKVGAVSAEVALQMAKGVCTLFAADASVCDTGIAGPGGATATKPVGLFYFGVCVKGQVFVYERVLAGKRAENKREAALIALELLKEKIAEV